MNSAGIEEKPTVSQVLYCDLHWSPHLILYFLPTKEVWIPSYEQEDAGS